MPSLAEIGLVWSVGSREEVHLTMTKTTDIRQSSGEPAKDKINILSYLATNFEANAY